MPADTVPKVAGPWEILLFVPNLVGYVRIGVVIAALTAGTSHAELVVWLFIICFVLDFVDGLLARRLNQTSGFGALLDVLIDNSARGLMWCWGASSPLPCLMLQLEMLTLLCTHNVGGAAWKTDYFVEAPYWVKAVMRNGFKNPSGVFVVVGLMGCPLWLWATRWLPGTAYSSLLLGVPLIAARCVGAALEGWIVVTYLAALLNEDAKVRGKKDI